MPLGLLAEDDPHPFLPSGHVVQLQLVPGWPPPVDALGQALHECLRVSFGYASFSQ